MLGTPRNKIAPHIAEDMPNYMKLNQEEKLSEALKKSDEPGGKVLQEAEEHLKKVKALVDKASKKDGEKLRVVRGNNQKQQLEAPAWKTTIEIANHLRDKLSSNTRKKKLEELEKANTTPLLAMLTKANMQKFVKMKKKKMAEGGEKSNSNEGSEEEGEKEEEEEEGDSSDDEEDTWHENLVNEILKQDLIEDLNKYWDAVKQLRKQLESEKLRTEPGPVGDIPLHNLFLLGAREEGKRQIKKKGKKGEKKDRGGKLKSWYELKRERDSGSECDINTPYMSDIDPWVRLGVIDENDPYDDGGLYTGETVLHIAIVGSAASNDTRLVEWMLNHGADVTARARGSFFKGHVIKKVMTPEQRAYIGRWKWSLSGYLGKEGFAWPFSRRASEASRGGKKDGSVGTGGEGVGAHRKLDEHDDSMGTNYYKGQAGWDKEGLDKVYHETDKESKDRQPGVLRRIEAWIFQSDPRVNSRHVLTIHNRHSACDYGEYPLSFAASVGCVDACRVLKNHANGKRQKGGQKDKKQSGIPPGEWIQFVKTQRSIAYDIAKSRGGLKMMADRKKRYLFPEVPSSDKNPKDWTPISEKTHKKGYKHYDLFMNAQDTEGNTALHMAVFHNKINAVDWLIQEGAKPSLRLLNQDGLTPFTLAAKLGNTEMLHHILDHVMSKKAWTYGSVNLSKMSLEQMDSFRIKDNDLHDMPNWRSAIEIIVEHEVVEFAKDPLFNKLIKEKWQKFGRRRYILRSLLPYVIYLIVFTFMVVVRCIEVRDVFERSRNGEMLDLSGETIVEWGNRIMQDDRGARTQLQVRQSMAVVVLQALLGGPGSLWLFSQGWVSRRLSRRDLDPEDDGHRNWTSFVFKNMNFILHCLSSILVWAALIARCVGAESIELDFLAVASISIWCNLLVLTVPFEFFGYIIITTYKMLVGDVVQFAAAYIFLTLGFSLGTYALYQMSPKPDEGGRLSSNPLEATMAYFWVSMADQLDIDFSLSRSPTLLMVIHLTFIVISPWLLLNLLIAMMGQTFEKSAEDTQRTWIFPFASLVLMYEKGLLERERREPSGMYRSGKFAGNEDDVKTDKDLYWKSVFYEIEVGEDKDAKADVETRRAYHSNYKAVFAKLEESIDEAKARISTRLHASTRSSHLHTQGGQSHRDREMSRQIDGMLKDLEPFSAKSLHPRRQQQQQQSVPASSGTGRGRTQATKHSKSPARVKFARIPLVPLPLEVSPDD